MSRKLPQKLRDMEDALFNAGISTGEQYASDCISAAAYDCGVSKNTIRKIMKLATQYGKDFSGSLDVKSDNEADVKQEKLDARLRTIFEEDFVPFVQRYTYLKKVRY